MENHLKYPPSTIEELNSARGPLFLPLPSEKCTLYLHLPVWKQGSRSARFIASLPCFHTPAALFASFVSSFLTGYSFTVFRVTDHNCIPQAVIDLRQASRVQRCSSARAGCAHLIPKSSLGSFLFLEESVFNVIVTSQAVLSCFTLSPEIEKDIYFLCFKKSVIL